MISRIFSPDDAFKMADEITRYTTAHQELNEAQEPHSRSLPPSPHKDQSKASSIHSTSPDSVDTGPLSPSSSNLESRYDPGVFTEANGDIAIRTEEEFEHVWKQVEDLRLPSVPGTPSGTNSAFSSCHSLAYSDDKIKVPFQREGGSKKIAHFASVAGAHTSLKRPPWNGGARPNNTKMIKGTINISLRWRHNGSDSVSNHQPHYCLLNRLFRRRSKWKKTSKLRVTGLCVGNSPGTGEFPAKNGQLRGKCFHLMTSPCWGRYKMAAIYWSHFQINFFLCKAFCPIFTDFFSIVQLTINQHWFK